MSIFNIEYSSTVWKLLVPPDKRMPNWLAWGCALMKGKQWWHDSIFTTYTGGSADSPYSTTTTYYSGDRVIYYLQAGGAYYGDNAVYEALCIHADGSINTSGFSGIAPAGNNVVPATIPPTVTNAAQALNWLYNLTLNPGCLWVLVSPNFTGVNERLNYSAQKLIFEYALNRWFHTTFRQPNGIPEDPILNPSGTPDIYITINSNTTNQFFWGNTLINSYFSSTVNFSDASFPLAKFFSPGNSFLLVNEFSINIPVADYNALDNEAPVLAGSNTIKRDAIVSAFANQYSPAGSTYNIVTY
jgi:hypothetical protein